MCSLVLPCPCITIKQLRARWLAFTPCLSPAPVMSGKSFRIFTGSAHPQLAHDICGILDTDPGQCTLTVHSDSETHVMIEETVRGQDIFLVQPCCPPVNEKLMEALLLIDALRRASAQTVSVVMPYFPYARQERMAHGREAVSARVVANMLETAGADRVIFIDIHALAIQGFFNIPVESLTAIPLLCEHLQGPHFDQCAIVSPDVGRASMAGRYASILGLPLVVMHKRRLDHTQTETTHIVGTIAHRSPIVIDDIIAGGSVLRQLDALFAQGAVTPAYFVVTHALLLPSALQQLACDERIVKLITTDTVPMPAAVRQQSALAPKIAVVSVAPLLAEVILRVFNNVSISNRVDYQ